MSIKAHTAPQRLPLSAKATPVTEATGPACHSKHKATPPSRRGAAAGSPHAHICHRAQATPLTCHSNKPRPLAWQSLTGHAPSGLIQCPGHAPAGAGAPLAAAPHGPESRPPRPLLAPAPHHRPAPRCRSPPPARPRPPYSRGKPQRRGGCLIGREVNGVPRGPRALAGREALG